jgi:hypothetical protein
VNDHGPKRDGSVTAIMGDQRAFMPFEAYNGLVALDDCGHNVSEPQKIAPQASSTRTPRLSIAPVPNMLRR